MILLQVCNLNLFHLSQQHHPLCFNIHLDFYYEETQIKSTIWDLNSEIKSSEESKVAHFEEKSENLNELKIELDRESNLAKCKHQIHIFIFNWMELSIIYIISVIFSCF